MKTEILKVTPKMAMDFLSRNENNRHVSKTVVTRYKFQMQKGEWLLSPDGLSFDKTGNVLNGQHRLHAVIESGVDVMFVVNYDVPREIFSVIDTGKNRTGGDVLSTFGIKYANSVAGAVKRHIILKASPIDSVSERAGGYMAQVHGTNTAILNQYLLHPELYLYIVTKITSMCGRMSIHGIIDSSSIAAYLHLDKGHKLDDVMSFFAQLYSGNEVSNYSILLLRDKLLKNKYSKVKMTGRYKMLLIKKVWNYYVSGTDVKVLRLDIEKESSIKFK